MKSIRTLFLAAIFFMGVGSAIFSPLQSYFFIRELGASPALVGSYLGMTGFAAILISHCIAVYSDRGVSRRWLIVFSALCGVAAFAGFILIRDFYMLAVIGLTLMSCVAIGAPQLFALASETFKEGHEAFMGLMRAMVSVAWVVGPPMAFSLVGLFGFPVTFGILVATSATVALIALNLPDPVCHGESSSKLEGNAKPDRSGSRFKLLCAVAGMGLLYSAINNYTILMPLYIVQTVRLGEWTPGVLFGLTAAFEIPLMLMAGRISKRVSHQGQLVLAAFLGGLYYTLFMMLESVYALLPIQAIGAASVALSATAGLQFFQHLMRERLGYASTLYTNAIVGGMALGAFAGGMVASVWGYRLALAANVMLCVAALGCFYLAAEKNRLPILSLHRRDGLGSTH
ncbi:sugar efflux transporter [Jeongeupia chitinilytica]|uniref:Sugar efflux transporter SetB n=1 Tax=Jeongeupia chitinilytica TaxID=1041641 RepID=A0ABQ3H0A6_9NEIS|nr:sugar efflux transporter [Jeongeupia chitinilytica]GHD62210.1 sugar efflux transporter SetB [Jeongeupia chitinilytica]